MLEWHGLKIIKQSERILETKEKEAAERIFKDAKANAPVGTVVRSTPMYGKSWQSRYPGRLRGAIQKKKSRYEGGGYIIYVPGQGSNTYYVRWVELGAPARRRERWKEAGHRNPVPRQPFLRPALYKEKNRWVRSIKTAFRMAWGFK